MGEAWKLDRFHMDNSGMGDMLKADWLRDDFTERMGRTLDQAEAGGGEFSYHIEQSTTDRVRVAVGSDDEGVLFYESATGNLLRALDAAGGSS